MPYLDLNKIAVVLIFLIILVVIQVVVKRSKLLPNEFGWTQQQSN